MRSAEFDFVEFINYHASLNITNIDESERLRRLTFLPPLLQLMGSRRPITLLDNCLNGLGYHMGTFAAAILDAAPDAEVLGHRSCDIDHPRILPCFSRSLFAPEARFPGMTGGLLERIFGRLDWAKTIRSCNRTYHEDLDAQPAERWREGGILLMENADIRTALGAIQWSKARGPDHSLVLHFVNPPARALGFLLRLHPAYRLRTPDTRHIHLAAENPQMAETCSRQLKLPCQPLIFPLPKRDIPPASAPLPGQPLVLSLPGGPRQEKGFDLAIDAISLLRPELKADKIQLLVQEHAHDVAEEGLADSWQLLEQLQAEFPRAIHILPAKLPEPEYVGLLRDSHLVLTPYRRSAYAHRGSWVPIEAIAAGRPVLITEGIQMASEVHKAGAGLFVEDGSPQAIADAIQDFLEAPGPQLDQARQAARQWNQDHGPDAFLDRLEKICE